MKRILFLSVLVLSGLHGTISGQNNDSFINGLIQEVNSYYQDHAHDNLYVHTDRSVYFPGDEIFFKAYVNDAATLLPSERSDKLTLMMLDSEGNEAYSSIIDVMNGVSWGRVQVPENLSQGMIHLVAYVSNGGEITANKVFNKPIFIANPKPGVMMEYDLDKESYEAGDEIEVLVNAFGLGRRPNKNLKINYTVSEAGEVKEAGNLKTGKSGEVVMNYTVGQVVKQPLNIAMTVDKRKNAQSINIGVPIRSAIHKLEFYPEGGCLVAGSIGKLGFKSYNEHGNPTDFSGSIFEGDQKVKDISTIAKGVGITEFTPESGKNYHVKIGAQGETFDLPPLTANGAALRIKEMDGARLKVGAAFAGSDYPESLEVIVAIFRKGLVYWSAPGALGQINGLGIPVNRIPSGVSKLVLFSKDGTLLSERMFYLHKEPMLELELSLDKMVFNNRQKVLADLTLNGKVPGDVDRVALSVSVVPEDLLLGNDIMLENYMMLETDFLEDGRSLLKEAIMSDDEPLIIDAILLSSNWNGYSWERVLGGDMKKVEHVQNDINKDISNIFYGQNYYPDAIQASGLMDLSYGITDKRHPGIGDPHYKKQLESGMSVLEVIKSIKSYTMYGDLIVFSGGSNSLYNQQGALIVIDNQPMGQSSSILKNISPQEVEEINISTNTSDIQHYTGLNVVGLIEIRMKGSVADSRLAQQSPRDKEVREAGGNYMKGYPDYSAEMDNKSVMGDHRRLIFWNPSLVLDENNKQSIEFYTSDTNGRYVITVQGMVGMFPVAKQLVFEVK